ncbi:MAG TPA: glycosyltransferase, partial [Chloroflexota bacterium]|nr:glycosyltransferase [Chloroflexota bacterium]
PDVRLRVVGSRPPSLVTRMARNPAVTVTGYLPDIREAVGRATVAVCPMTVKVGIQNKVLEAMAMGLPVVCTKQGATGLQSEADRDLLVAGSPAAFAESVCRLLDEPDLRARVGDAGRRYVERHHRWEDAGLRLETLYQEARTAREPALMGEAREDIRRRAVRAEY